MKRTNSVVLTEFKLIHSFSFYGVFSIFAKVYAWIIDAALIGNTVHVCISFLLGFPVVNDPMYRGSIWGPHEGKGGEFGRPDEEVTVIFYI